MAKYTILMSCGHEETKELLGKTSDRERKIEYFKANGLCKECYKMQMEEKAITEGFNFNATVLPYIDTDDGSILINVWFSGNTKPHKDEIKSLGYRWSRRESADDYYSFDSDLCWNAIVKLDNLQKEIEKAKLIGANNIISEKGLYAMTHYKIALKKQKEWCVIKEKISTIQKPKVPQILQGHKWNQKIYGRSGSYSIYPDGEKISITDEQAEEIRLYLTEKEEYKKKVEEVKNA